jgi:DNA modification methylase
MPDLKVTEFDTNKLIPDPENARRHPQPNKNAIRRSIQQFGIRRPLVASEDTNIVYAGNGVLEAALELGIEKIPVAWIPSGTPVELCKAYAIADNRSAELAEWNPEQLEKLIASMPTMELANMGFDEEGLKQIISQKPIDKEETFDVGAAMGVETTPITKTGDVWLCGEHRVMCGDSTKVEDVEKLMKGEKADLFLTDPPYGVKYSDKNTFLNKYDKGNRIQDPIEHDHQDLKDLYPFWKTVCVNAYSFTSDTASYYWFACQGGDQMMMMMSINDANWKVRHELIWVKNNHVLGRTDYNYKHEPILFGWKKDGTHKFYGGFQTSVLEFDKPLKSELHPTQKPVELIELLIANSTLKEELILDPFLGSGTTLIACEKTGRRCVGMEISCHYTDVCCRRYYDFTGNVPINEATQEPFLTKDV